MAKKQDTAGADDAPKTEDAPTVALVKMTRSPDNPEPHEADVHPDEVVNFAAGGWTVAA